MLLKKRFLDKLSKFSFLILNGAFILFLILPFLAIIPMSFGSTMFLTFPPEDFSIKWYQSYLDSADWRNATLLGFEVAFFSAFFSVIIGTMAAVGVGHKILTKKIALFRTLIIGLIISPALCPIVVSAVAELMFFLKIHLYDTAIGLIIAHAVLGIPFVFISVLSTLNSVDWSVEKAALNLGAKPIQVFSRVTLPLIRSGILVGAIFAFMNSFNEIVVTVFITGVNTVTLSRRLWDGIQYEIDPTITVVSTLIIVFSLISLSFFSVLRKRRTIF